MDKASAIKLTKLINEMGTKKDESKAEDEDKLENDEDQVKEEEEKDVSSYNEYFAENTSPNTKKSLPFKYQLPVTVLVKKH